MRVDSDPRAREAPAAASPLRLDDDHETSDRRRSALVLIAAFCALAALIAALAYWVWQEQVRTVRGQQQDTLAAVAELKASQVSDWLGERLADADTIAADALLSDAVAGMAAGTAGPATHISVRRLLIAEQQGYDYADVVVLDRDGRILMRVPATARHPLGDAVFTLARQALRTGVVQDSDLYMADDGEPRLEIAVPLSRSTQTGVRPGVVVLHVDPSRYLYPFLQSWPLPSATGETLLVERRDDRVVYLNDLRFREGAALAISLPLDTPGLPAAKAALGMSGVEEGLDYRRVPVLAAYRPIPDTRWGVVAKLDTSEVVGPMRARAAVTAAFAFLLVALAGTAILLVWRSREARASAALAASQGRFRTLFDTMTEGVVLNEIVLDAQGRAVDYRVLETNPAFARQTGFEQEWAAGRLASDIYQAGEPPFLAEYGRVAATGEPTTFETYSEAFGRYLEVSAVSQGDGRFATISEDVTERRRAAEEVERLNAQLEQRVRDRTAALDASNKELEAFAYSVSHDLRAPLRHIAGFSELLAARLEDRLDEKSAHYLDTISRSVHEMGVLIDDLLQFSRTGRVEVQLQDVDMAALVGEVCARLAEEETGRDISWQVAALPVVTGDRALLRQVWANLLGNAVKYTRGGGHAIVEVGHEVAAGEGSVAEDVFFVRDDGVGFDMQYVDKLFGVFQRLHGGTEFEGTGIGLANVKRIVTRLGGRVWAEGALGEGATFWFSLPRRKGTDGDRSIP